MDGSKLCVHGLSLTATRPSAAVRGWRVGVRLVAMAAAHNRPGRHCQQPAAELALAPTEGVRRGASDGGTSAGSASAGGMAR